MQNCLGFWGRCRNLNHARREFTVLLSLGVGLKAERGAEPHSHFLAERAALLLISRLGPMGSAASAAEKRKMPVIFSPVTPERPCCRVFAIPPAPPQNLIFLGFQGFLLYRCISHLTFRTSPKGGPHPLYRWGN